MNVIIKEHFARISSKPLLLQSTIFSWLFFPGSVHSHGFLLLTMHVRSQLLIFSLKRWSTEVLETYQSFIMVTLSVCYMLQKEPDFHPLFCCPPKQTISVGLCLVWFLLKCWQEADLQLTAIRRGDGKYGKVWQVLLVIWKKVGRSAGTREIHGCQSSTHNACNVSYSNLSQKPSPLHYQITEGEIMMKDDEEFFKSNILN